MALQNLSVWLDSIECFVVWGALLYLKFKYYGLHFILYSICFCCWMFNYGCV